jgi:magnesium transporter
MLKTFQLSNNHLCATTEDKSNLFVYVCPDEKEKSYLTSFWKIDEHNLNSALDPDELGRIEFDSDHLVAIIKKPKKHIVNNNFIFKISSIGLFLYIDKLVVIVDEEDIDWDSRIFGKLTSVRDAFLRVIYHCVIHFEEHLKVIRKTSEVLEGEINQAITNKDLLHMFKLSKGLVYYLDAINSNSKVVERLKMHSSKLSFDQEMSDFLDDLMIESDQCYEQADSYLDVLSSMTDALASIINNNLNIRLKRLTVLSICIMTPTLVVSLFSMNVPLPLPQSGTLFSFWVVLAMAIFSVAALLLLGYYKKL